MKSRYKGILSQPVTEPLSNEEVWERVVALSEHYDVELDHEGAMARLFLELAIDHVPGFKVIEERQPKSSPHLDLILMMKMVELINKRHSKKRAAELIVKKHPNLGFKSPGALRVWFEEMTNPSNMRHEKRRRAMLELLSYTLSDEGKTKL